MMARMRYTPALIMTATILWLGGCATPDGQVNQAGRQPLSKLPNNKSLDMPEIPDREILPETHMAAGRLHESQNRLARAVEQYRLAVALKPDYVEALNRLGIVLDQLGRFKEADKAFRDAIAAAPDQAYLHNNLAFSYMMQLKWRDAKDALNKALTLHPDFARARVNLAMTLAQLERFDEAMTQFQTVLSAEDAYYNMGLMYQSKRRLVDAARSFKAALELNPDMVAARKRLDMLPADIISEAERQQEAIASPAPAELDTAPAEANPSERPATQPASEETSDASEAPIAEPEAPILFESAVPFCLSLSIEEDMLTDDFGSYDYLPMLLDADITASELASIAD